METSGSGVPGEAAISTGILDFAVIGSRSRSRRRGCQEDAMSTQSWTRREVLKVVSSAALVAAYARPAAAQSVKWSAGTQAPKSKAPANATDCHHHIYDAKYPVDPKATLRPADALVDDYRGFQKRIGTTR